MEIQMERRLTPVVEAAIAAIQNPANHGYPRLKAPLASVIPSPVGINATALTSIRIAKLYPYQVLEGLTTLRRLYYPGFGSGSLLIFVVLMPVVHNLILLKNNWLIDLADPVAKKQAKFLFNYPSNPTAASTREFFKRLSPLPKIRNSAGS